MTSKMYGAALPPGLEAPTCGELRIRLEKLILDNTAMNHNPLVRFNLGQGSGGGGGGDAAPSPSTTTGAAPAVSPNKFVVPVDYCAVSPIFWGEARPTAHCQPSTPGQPGRGAVTLVYPIKVPEESFLDYLAGMSRSPQRGLLLEVYVPSSYSGRPAVPVGKSIVFMDALSVAKPLQGWFTVGHTQAAGEEAAKKEKDDDDGDAEKNDGSDDGSVFFFKVGKMKLSMRLVFFNRAKGEEPTSATVSPSGQHRRPSSGGVSGAGSRGRDGVKVAAAVAVATRSQSHLNESRESVSSAVRGRQHTTGSSSSGKGPRPAGMNVSFHSNDDDNSNRGSARNRSIEVDMTGIATDVEESAPPRRDSDRSNNSNFNYGSNTAVATGEDLAENELVRTARGTVQRQKAGVAVGDILDRGLQLRERMMRAAAAAVDSGGGGGGRSVKPAVYPHTRRNNRGRRHHDEDDNNDDDDADDATAYSSENTDEERFAFQLQRDLGRNKTRPHNRHDDDVGAFPTATPNTTTTGGVIPVVGRRPANPSPPLAHHHHQRPATVELAFSDFSFGATPMTADLSEMRVSVRLSKDMSTDEPTTGPFSSYIHQVPLSQNSICLSIAVRSYSEESSRLVVELIKVRSRGVTGDAAVSGAGGGGGGSTPGRRQVVSEELLGLCIIGVYPQSREVAMRDPITNLNNAYCKLSLTFDGASVADVSTATAAVPGLSQAIAALNATATDGNNRSCRSHRKATGAGYDSCSSTSSSSSATDSSLSSSSSSSASSPSGHRRRNERSSSGSGRHRRCHHSRRGHSRSRSANRVGSRATAPATVPSGAGGIVGVHRPLHGNAAATAGYRAVRLCISIQRAVQLPGVSLAPRHGSGSKGHWTPQQQQKQEGSSVALSLGAATDGGNFAAPNSFFLVDALLAPPQQQQQQCRRVGGDNTNTSVLSTIGVASSSSSPRAELEGWVVESYAHGLFDRTNIVAASQKPVFNYSCVIDIPPFPITTTTATATVTRGNRSDDAGGARERGKSFSGGNNANDSCCVHDRTREEVFGHHLGALRLSLWHHEPNSSSSSGAATAAARHDETEAEVRFWSASAHLGECLVDLTPLRFLDRLDGFYKVSSQLPVFAIDEEGQPRSTGGGGGGPQTVGHVHVSVWTA